MFTANGWRVDFHRVFAERYRKLVARVTELRQELSDEEYRQHKTVKLPAQVTRLIRETIPANPDAPEFRLKQDLAKFRRAKGSGLPPRYRLFFVFSSRLHAIIFLYLNDDTSLSKEGADTDPYEIFKPLLNRGEIGQDFDENWAAIQAELRGQGDDST